MRKGRVWVGEGDEKQRVSAAGACVGEDTAWEGGAGPTSAVQLSSSEAGPSRPRERQTVGTTALHSTIATTAVSMVAGAALLISVWSCVADIVSVRASCVGAAVGWAGGVSSCRGEAHDLRHRLCAPFAISNFDNFHALEF